MVNIDYLIRSSSNLPAGFNSSEMDDFDAKTRTAQIIDILGCFLIPATSILGIIFNTLTAFVVCFMGLDTSSLVYMLLVAIGDSVSVFIDGILNIGLVHWNVAKMLIRDNISCKVGQWISYVTTFGTQFTLVLFTVDRFIAMFTPIYYKQRLKYNLWYPVKGTGIYFFSHVVGGGNQIPVKATTANYIITSLLLSGNLYVFSLEGNKSCCLLGSHLSDTAHKIYSLYTATLLYSVIPGSVMLVLNIGIIIKIRRRNARRASTVSAELSIQDRSQEHSITCGLLMVSFCYIFITSLGSVNMYILNSYIQPRIAGNNSNLWAERAKLTTYMVQWGAVINQSLNFFLYILGSHAFRTEFLQMLRTKKRNNWARWSGRKRGAINVPIPNQRRHSMYSDVHFSTRTRDKTTAQRKSVSVAVRMVTSV